MSDDNYHIMRMNGLSPGGFPILENSKRERFKLDCMASNVRHTRFRVFDIHGVNCGEMTILTDDVKEFISRDWNGDVVWNGHLPEPEPAGNAGQPNR